VNAAASILPYGNISEKSTFYRCCHPTYLDASVIVPDSNFRQPMGFRAACFNTREVEHQFNRMLALEAT